MAADAGLELVGGGHGPGHQRAADLDLAVRALAAASRLHHREGAQNRGVNRRVDVPDALADLTRRY